MSQEAVARSREKDNENKKEIRAIRLSIGATACRKATRREAWASFEGWQRQL